MSVRGRTAPSLSLLFRLAGVLALCALALASLVSARQADPATGQERYDLMAGALDSAHSLEQSFVSARSGLCAIEVFPLIPPGSLDSAYTLTLRLLESDGTRELARTRVSLASARSQKNITIAFAPQPDSSGKSYRLLVESNAPPDTVTLLASSEDAYPSGELRLDGQSIGRDLAFRTFTALLPGSLLSELAGNAPDYARLLLLCVAFGLVGWAFFVLIGYWPDPGVWERALWSVGMGLALAPTSYLLAGRFTTWLLGGLCLLALIRAALAQRAARPAWKRDTWRSLAAGWELPALFLWSLAVRLLQVRDVPAPMWVDGLSHIQMLEKIVRAGRMPGGLLYHIGFHTQMTLTGDWLNQPLPRAMVLFGQLISALGGPALYLFVKHAAGLPPRRARHAALLSALALTCFPSLPGYLINWGRYPFLLGLLLLPLALSATQDALRDPQTPEDKITLLPIRISIGPLRLVMPHPGRFLVLAALLIGMFLSHYGTVSFWLSFCVVFLLVERPTWLRQVRPGRALLAVGLVLALAALAGYLRFGDNLSGKLASTIAESRQVSDELNYDTLWQLNLRAGGTWLVLAGVLGALWAWSAARRTFFLTAGWFLAQAALIAIQSPLLGFALASYANLLLALSLPLAVLAGSLLESFFYATSQPQTANHSPQQAHHHPYHWQVALAALLAISGGLSQAGILNPASLLYSPADTQAMRWIRANTPAQATFLVNSQVWSNLRIVPNDGGGWLPTITGRPAVFLSDRSQRDGLDAFIEQNHVRYIYLGRFSGFLQRAVFEEDPTRYQRLYHQSGVDIYAVIEQ